MLHIVLSRAAWFVVLLLLQVLVFNHVHIMGYATPLPYLYFLLILPSSTPRWLYVLLGFVMGLTVDLFTNTPGVAAASMSLLGLLAPLFLRLYLSADQDEDSFEPSRRTMEWGPFIRYVLTAVVLYCAVFFTIEAFTFFDVRSLLLNVAGSSLLTSLIVLTMELIRTK